MFVNMDVYRDVEVLKVGWPEGMGRSSQSPKYVVFSYFFLSIGNPIACHTTSGKKRESSVVC